MGSQPAQPAARSGSGAPRLALLGAPGLVDADGSPVALPAKAIALLAYLALEHDQSHPRRALAELLWPGPDDVKARRNLRLTLFRLREALGGTVEWLEATRDHVQVVIGGARGLRVDVLDLMAGEQFPGGQPLTMTAPDGCPDYSVWLAGWRERVAVAWIGRARAAGEAALATNRPREAERLGRMIIDADPLEEVGHELVIRAHLLADHPDDARQHLDTYTDLLQSDLGITPAPGLRALIADARAGAGDASDSAGSRAKETTADLDPDVPLAVMPLPAPLTSFHGRRVEMQELGTTIRSRSARLLSVVGPGGMGKTRLCLEVARSHGRYFQEGAAFIALDGVADLADVPLVIATALGLDRVAVAPDPLAALTERLVEREILLVIDNAEHLLSATSGGPGIGALLAGLLTACPHLVCLVSSRQALRINGEDVTALGGLSHPAAPMSGEGPELSADAPLAVPAIEAFDAVRLLVDRLHRVDKGIRLDSETAPLIVETCQRVEGMPLGLELAASAVRDVPLSAVVATLRDSPEQLSPVIEGTPARHAELSAVYRYSVERLSADDQALLPKLAVFAPGFDAEAAARVAGATPGALARLCHASLLSRNTDGRYRMHVLLRQIAGRDTDAEVHDAHAAHYLDVLSGVAEASRGAGAAKAFAQLHADRPNHLEAWRHAVERGRVERLVSASTGLMTWAITSGEVPRAAEMLQEARAIATDPVDVATLLLREATAWKPRSKSLSTLEPMIHEALALIEDSDGVASLRGRLHMFLAMCTTQTDAPPEHADRLTRTAGLLAEESEDWGLLGFVNYRQAGDAIDRNDVEEGERLMRRAIDIFESSGNLRGLAIARKGLSWLHLETFHLWDAHETCVAALKDFEQLGNRLGVMFSEEIIGEALARLGSFDRAVPILERALASGREMGATGHRAYTLATLGMALRGAGEHDEAERVFADAVETARTRRQAEWLRYALFPWTRILLEEGRLVQAELCARELVESVEQATAPTTLLAARALLARVLLAAGNLDEAVGHAELAFRAIETPSDGRLALVAALDTAVECATVLRAGGREEDAETVWVMGATTLNQLATSIPDPTIRAGLLALPSSRALTGAG